MGAVFKDYGGFLVVKRKGCGFIERLKDESSDIESKRRWYIGKE